MSGYDYLVVGGGLAADAAVRGIREIDACGTIGIVSKDDVPPYDRPPLSKGLWAGGRLEDVFHHTDYQGMGVKLHLTTEVTEILPPEREVRLLDGTSLPYGKLLLATGTSPRSLPKSVSGHGDARLYRTVTDYLAVRRAIDTGARRIVVVGGGFIGAELAAALSCQPDVHVTLIFPERALWSKRLPEDLSVYLTEEYRRRGVEIVTGEGISAIDRTPEGQLRVRAQGARVWEADLIVVGLGVIPETGLAAKAGISAEDGIIVDETCRTSVPDVFACGDVANFPSVLGGRLRVEHEDHARTQGRLAGRNMTGLRETYGHIPMLYSDLFDLGFEAVGRLDAELTTFEDWADPFRQGVVYYLGKSRQLVGVLLWNVWGQVDRGRELLLERREWRDVKDLAGRIAMS